MKRHYSLADKIIMQVDHCLNALIGDAPAQRPYPANTVPESDLAPQQRQHSAGLMRVNHSGEVCAQALYNAQAIVARDAKIRDLLIECGKEETDHLAWCHQRLQELDSHRSYLNLFWYWNSFFIGLAAGIAGDAWSLGFVEETEIQVGKHLQGHLSKIDPRDQKSLAVIQQMHEDEAQHAKTAKDNGSRPLAPTLKNLMALHARVMTCFSYWI